MKTIRTVLISLLIASGFGLSAFADAIQVTTTNDPLSLAQAFLGDNITVLSAKYTGSLQAGTYQNCTVESEGNPNLSSGTVLSTGKVCYLNGGTNTGNADSHANLPGDYSSGDADLNRLVGYGTYNASVLEVDFTVKENVTNTLCYVFGSDEFDKDIFDRVNNISSIINGETNNDNKELFDFFNDVFCIYLDGKNIATIPNTDLPVSVYNLYTSAPSELIFNKDNGLVTEMNAFTVPMQATFSAEAGTTYHLKIAIANGGWSSVDSWVLLGHPAVQVPEPSMMALLVTGIILLISSGFILRKKWL